MPARSWKPTLRTRNARPSVCISLPAAAPAPGFVLALDEPGDEDARFEQDGFAFCINKELLQQVKSVSIDLSYLGFTVTPEVPLPSAGGSSCGGCCGSCGSHQ